ncbi:MAG: MATE family efflux transporter [Bacteroidota bacterium]
MSHSEKLGSDPIPRLLWQQALPASIGILVMSIYGIVDTIFVGRYVGTLAIGAITVVLPITYLIASIGMAIGIGGASIISRAMGGGSPQRAFRVFGNQATLTMIFVIVAVGLGLVFQDQVLQLFGGKGDILPAARSYFRIILLGVPFLAWAMMANNVIRAEGAPKIAMMVMLVPAVVNLILDPILIIGLEMGLEGAAWATTISYICSALFTLWFFFSGKSELQLRLHSLVLDSAIVREIFSLGSVTLARQSVISILSIVLNNSLFLYGGEQAISVYGIIQRVMMFALFPVLGITQGFLPIAGFNYGAQKWERVRNVINLSLKSGTAIAVFLFVLIITFTETIVSLFTIDAELIRTAVPALRYSFLATPLILIPLIGSAYFQAIGKAVPALFLTLTKQGFCLIPLLLILPPVIGLDGIWFAFPIADILSAGICFYFLRKETQHLRAEGAALVPSRN